MSPYTMSSFIHTQCRPSKGRTSGSIKKYGFSRMEQFQKAMLFIMSISTRKTTGLKTLP